MGDLNLDMARKKDETYKRRTLLNEFADATEAPGYEYLTTVATWQSYGRFRDSDDGLAEHRSSVLDHCYVAGVRAASIAVLDDATTDHRPVLLITEPARISGSANAPTAIKRRNFKGIERAALEAALESMWDWSTVHQIRDVNIIHNFVVAGITAALDVVAPLKEIRVKPGGNLYLTRETLAAMKKRDDARGLSNSNYKFLRNRATRLVRHDKMTSNLSMLAESNNSSKVLWKLANSALGKQRPTLPNSLSLPDGTKTVGNASAADTKNEFYKSKVLKLREDIPVAPPAPKPAWPPEAGRV
jgi:hypothetical protein